VDSAAADVTAITQTRTSTTEARRRALIVVIPPVVQMADLAALALRVRAPDVRGPDYAKESYPLGAGLTARNPEGVRLSA
jgi:hypothetical protein